MKWDMLLVQCDMTLHLIEELTDDGELPDDQQLAWQRLIDAGCEEPELYPDLHAMLVAEDNSAEYFEAWKIFDKLYKKLRGER